MIMSDRYDNASKQAEQPTPSFARGFRLHLMGRTYDGAEFPDGRALVIEEPAYGLTVTAPSVDDLLRGYGLGRIEWPTEAGETP